MLSITKSDLALLGDGHYCNESDQTVFVCSACNAGITRILLKEIFELWHENNRPSITGIYDMTDATDTEITSVLISTDLFWDEFTKLDNERKNDG